MIHASIICVAHAVSMKLDLDVHCYLHAPHDCIQMSVSVGR